MADSDSRRHQREIVNDVKDPFARNSLRFSYHLRRYLLLYVCGALGAIALALFPTVITSGTNLAAGSGGGAGASTGGVNYGGGSGSSGGSAGPVGGGTSGSVATGGTAGGVGGTGSSAGGTSSAIGGTGSTPGGSGAVSTGGSGPSVASPGGGGTSSPTGGTPTPGGTGSAPAATSTGAAPSATSSSSGANRSTSTGKATSAGSNTVQVGTGTTSGGFPCAKGVRQLPFSTYADPCEANYTGTNGGATYNGVTAKTITIAIRHTADSTGANAAAANSENEAAGGQSYSVIEGYTHQIVAYFNKTFELYGRQVKLVDFTGQGNNTNETLGQDQAGACADADTATTSLHAFGDLNFETYGFEPGPFSDCAARYHLYVPQGSAYFPESSYRADNPYVWATTTNCTLIAQEVGEFIGKQIAPYPTKWAGTDGITNLNGLQRKFATYVPNNAGYQQCVAQTKQIDEGTYHISPNREDQYNYALDISTFPQDAQRAIIQFAANKDTTVILACDPISVIFLTQDAVQQNYHPEWLLIGVAQTDTDSYAQLWDPAAIQGHLFGLSQAGSTASFLNPNSEDGKALTAAGVPLNISSATDYFLLLSMFNQLQAAGPTLTPANIAAGTANLPVGGGQAAPFGTWYFGHTHTAVIDSREIYWNGSQTSQANNKQGTYVQIYNGQRFQAGQFPTGEPPFYP